MRVCTYFDLLDRYLRDDWEQVSVQKEKKDNNEGKYMILGTVLAQISNEQNRYVIISDIFRMFTSSFATTISMLNK